MPRLYLPVLLLLSPLARAAAQATQLPEGSRVRLVAVGGYSAEGSVLRFTGDSLAVRAAVGDLVLPVAALRRLEVLRAQTGGFAAFRKGLMWGAGLGVVASAAAAIANGGSVDTKITTPLIGASTIAGGLVSLVFMRGHSWQIVALPGRANQR